VTNSSIQNRGAGILLHITSLPSPFGIGDLGEEARAFARFLHQSKQQWWQMLPLNPVLISPSPSPYSSTSSMAGNHLLISPELLVREGMLDSATVSSFKLPTKSNMDFVKAAASKEKLLEIAYQNFQLHASPSFRWEFDQFSSQEGPWLDDFALYVALKEFHKGSAWHLWEAPYKLRQTEALKTFSKTNKETMDKTKWLQFIFYRQWRQLKTYCHRLGIQLIGDLPFYVGADSVDVWANPSLFSVDEEGIPTLVAGVPPDYFSEVGQKWGMPVYHWEKNKELKYAWWKQRLRKNVELFDIVRFDHFRAFASYYEIPAGDPNAINGTWKLGPGAPFLEEIRVELEGLPFIAEDLGEPDAEVDKLRDQFGLPGMKILQFAFEKDMADSPHIPHRHSPNFVVYTGTHDNNTTLGWYRKNTSKAIRNRLLNYVGKTISASNVSEELIRMVYGSVGKLAIIPLQDILGLDEKACMNIPGTTSHNWLWRVLPAQLSPAVIKQLKHLTTMYGRDLPKKPKIQKEEAIVQEVTVVKKP
jgi:4-alpha-glucanotransferase